MCLVLCSVITIVGSSLCPRYDSSLSTQRSLGLPFRTTSTYILPILSPPTHCLATVTSVSPIWVISKEYLFTKENHKIYILQIGISSVQQTFLVGLSFHLYQSVLFYCKVIFSNIDLVEYVLKFIELWFLVVMVGQKNPLISLLKPQYKKFVILQHFINRVSVWMCVHASCQHIYV